MARTLLVVPTAAGARPGQDVPRAGAGPRPAGRERRLRQAGGSAPGRRRPRPLDRTGRGHDCAASPGSALHRRSWSSSSARADSMPCSRRSSLPGSRSMTDPTSSSSRGSARARPSCTPAGSTRRWPERSTPTSCLSASWPAAGRRRRATGRTARRSPGQTRPRSTVEGLAETLAIAASGYWSGEQARVVGCVVNGLPAERSVCGSTAAPGAGPARAPPHRRGAASPRADLAAGARPRPRAGPAGAQRG